MKRETSKKNAAEKPVIMLIAKQVKEAKAKGKYSSASQTWSNRDYELAASKKHNEDM